MATANDRAVLNTILHPLLPIGEDIDDAESEQNRQVQDQQVDDSELEAKQFEVLGVEAAESGKIEAALQHFDQAVATCPTRASCYNNRAQALRLIGRVPEALTDLNRAIELSERKGKAACQAFTQRAMIYRLQDMNELAKADYEAAAALGSLFAKNQLVMMNPYAAMCNKMLNDVIHKLQTGENIDDPPAA